MFAGFGLLCDFFYLHFLILYFLLDGNIMSASIDSFPKIAALGTSYVQNIFSEEVEITEKIDGSQFAFGWSRDGEFVCRSKGRQIHLGEKNDMFREAVNYTSQLSPLRCMYFYCEYLQRPRHNTLEYGRVPKNHLMLFGARTESGEFYERPALLQFSEMLDIELIPLIYKGKSSPEHVLSLVGQETAPVSSLGNTPMEGVVVKNYNRGMNYGERAYQIMSAKYVTEKFKERHGVNKEYQPRKDKWQEYLESLRTEARWIKAVQRRRDNGDLSLEPKDIGPMIADMMKDTIEEHKQEAMEELWKIYGSEMGRKVVAGFPEWYKEQLVKGTFSDEEK